MLGILKVKMSLEYPTFETAFESGLGHTYGHQWLDSGSKVQGNLLVVFGLQLHGNRLWLSR